MTSKTVGSTHGLTLRRASLLGAAVHPPHGLTLRQSSEKPTEGEVSRFALR